MHPTPTATWPICTLCAPLHLHLCTHHSIAQRARISLLSLANGFAPPWPQLIIVGTFETFTTCSRRWSISFWPSSTFLPSGLSIAVGTVLARGRVRSRGAQVRSAHSFLFLGVRLVDLVKFNVFLTLATLSDTRPPHAGSAAVAFNTRPMTRDVRYKGTHHRTHHTTLPHLSLIHI